MKIVQALVAIGGRASRLRVRGYDVPVSKSFIQFKGQPVLYWSLLSLHAAGLRNLVLAGDDILQLAEARLLVDDLPVSFRQVVFFQDPGLGVHGLPYQARALLDDQYLFDCGHGLMDFRHYRRLMSAKNADYIIFSAFAPHPQNLRQPVSLSRGRVTGMGAGRRFRFAIAHPMVIDRRYAETLPELEYDIRAIIDYYSTRRALRYIFSEMPPEFDIVEELRDVEAPYERYVESNFPPSG